ncbi:hypothetical protein [Rufibacter roseus]|nr:hypothetical protein [Rufibacter roseus]
METFNGKVTYLNSGDWVENLTALEYNAGKWSLYQHSLALAQMELADNTEEEGDSAEELHGLLTNHQLFENLLAEFNQLKLRA